MSALRTDHGVRMSDTPLVTARLRDLLDLVVECGDRVAWIALVDPPPTPGSEVTRVRDSGQLSLL